MHSWNIKKLNGTKIARERDLYKVCFLKLEWVAKDSDAGCRLPLHEQVNLCTVSSIE
jgi:hypothetical protein